MNERRAWSAGVISMILLIVLAAVGIVFGLGSGGLSVDTGIAQTTEMHADWECAWTNDDGVTTDCGGTGDEPAGDDALDPHGSFDFPYAVPFVEKNVGECLAGIAPPEAAPEGDQVAIVTIHTAYPSYECTFTFLITNTGNVPFSIAGYSTDVAPPLELMNHTCTTTKPDGGSSGAVQLDIGQSAIIQCTIHIMQEAQQAHTYSFTISACGDPCDGSFVRALWHIGTGQGVPASLGLRIASRAE